MFTAFNWLSYPEILGHVDISLYRNGVNKYGLSGCYSQSSVNHMNSHDEARDHVSTKE